MAKKMDAGNIIKQRSVPILDTDTNGTMFKKLSELGRDLLNEVLPTIFDKTNDSIPQDETMATYAYNITHEEQFINWNDLSKNIFNLVRGLNPNPTALTNFNDLIVKIYFVEMVDYDDDCEVGTIVKLDNKELWVKTIDGAVSIKDIQLAGKNRMDIRSFLNGQKLIKLGDKFY